MIRSTELTEREIGTSPLSLLYNGKGVTAAGETQPRPRWLSRMAAALPVILAGGILGLYFQGPRLRAFFDLTGLEPGAGARAPIALAVARTPSPQRVAAMASGDVMALGRLRPKDDIVIAYQVLSTDVADHIREYATLKAMGYPSRFFAGIVLEEALILAAIGFWQGLGLSHLFYEPLAYLANVPIFMPPERAPQTAGLRTVRAFSAGVADLVPTSMAPW